MTNNEILQADVLDILFEHRNKSYGAYALRKTYNRRLKRALGAALLTVLILFAISFIKNKKNVHDVDSDNKAVVINTIEFPKEEPEPPKKDQPKPPVATRDFQTIVVVPDEQADTAMVDIRDLDSAAIGNKNIEGEPPTEPAKAVTTSDGDGEKTTEVEVSKQPEIPNSPPKFPGGDAAWLAFLQRHLQSPEDLEPGQKIQVLVRFWVDVDGSVSKPEVVKSGGSSFDKEVLRVLKKMPKWEPAMQGGHRVAVAYMQPVTFIGAEE